MLNMIINERLKSFQSFFHIFNFKEPNVISTHRTVVKHQKKTGRVTVKVDESENIESEISDDGSVKNHDKIEVYHKHGFSWENIKLIQSTAWLTIAGDAIENIVHG